MNLDFLEKLWQDLEAVIKFHKAQMQPQEINNSIVNQSENNKQPLTIVNQPNLIVNQPIYFWDNSADAEHSVRLICDAQGLSLSDKNLICAVIHGESDFLNTAKNENRNNQGIVTSTDWGICQINDRFHIGANLDFPSVQYVLDNPDKAVEFMIRMFKAGKLSLWCAYSNGSYKKFLV